MHALVRGAAATGILAALSAVLAPRTADAPGGAGAGPSPSALAPSGSALPSSEPGAAGAACPRRQLPLGASSGAPAECLPVPSASGPLRSARLERLGDEPGRTAPLRSPWGKEGIPRLPGRPERYELYELPVQGPGEIFVSAATPADFGAAEPDRALRSAGTAPAEPEGIRLETSENAPVTLVELEGQQGNAEVMLVGQLYGVTVATRHRIETPGGMRDYVALYGELSHPGPEVVNGATLGRGAVVGTVGDRNGSDSPHLYFEVRELRQGARLTRKTLSELVRPTVSVPCDPRNVLPLR